MAKFFKKYNCYFFFFSYYTHNFSNVSCVLYPDACMLHCCPPKQPFCVTKHNQSPIELDFYRITYINHAHNFHILITLKQENPFCVLFFSSSLLLLLRLKLMLMPLNWDTLLANISLLFSIWTCVLPFGDCSNDGVYHTKNKRYKDTTMLISVVCDKHY